MQYKFKTIRADGINICTTTYNHIPTSFEAFCKQYFKQVIPTEVNESKEYELKDIHGAIIDSKEWPDLKQFASHQPVFIGVVDKKQEVKQVPEVIAKVIVKK